MPSFGVDFDGVVHWYRQGWLDGSIYDEPMPGAFYGLGVLMQTHPVFIFTSRNTQQVADWLLYQSEFDVVAEPAGEILCEFWNEKNRLLVTNRKLPAEAYLDDRAVRFVNWDQALTDLVKP